MNGNKDGPAILVFSTSGISDLAIDLAGASHMDYPASVQVISVPCSSGIRPEWVIHAIREGFNGVFIAADGTDCPYLPDCTDRTGEIVRRAQDMLRDAGLDPRRLKMAAICSVCSESFVSHIKKFHKALGEIDEAKT
ncbi:MAG: hydrogenase iron-sulfur subunit [Dissulfurimicrobium sp.]|uniref:hydrogenase iron-sulfur subunit n=1 Tax=Dissulfurimicrobium sp. TaxID=2022436 RepID=UPI00404A2A6F